MRMTNKEGAGVPESEVAQDSKKEDKGGAMDLSQQFLESRKDFSAKMDFDDFLEGEEISDADEVIIKIDIKDILDDDRIEAVNDLKSLFLEGRRANREQTRTAVVRAPESFRYDRDAVNAFASGVRWESSE